MQLFQALNSSKAVEREIGTLHHKLAEDYHRIKSECCLFQDSQHSICSGSADGLKNISEARLQTINLKVEEGKTTYICGHLNCPLLH